MRLKLSPRRRSERGAVAVLFAAIVVVLIGCAALGVDIAQQVQRKHLLIGQLDAASTAAASQLGNDGNIAGAVGAASTYFAENGQGQLDLRNVDFWCVVARKLNGDNTPFDPAMVANLQIPTLTQAVGECNPDAATATTDWRRSDYQNRVRAWDNQSFSMTCSDTLCAVPCALNANPDNGWNAGLSLANNRPIKCNTIRVGAQQGVPFSFGQAVGVPEGGTGSQISVACAGSCGAVAPNPMDVVVVADRTLSMTDPVGCTTYSNGAYCNKDYRLDLVAGIKGMLRVMTPEQQYVALGALGPSRYTRSGSESRDCNTSAEGLVYPSASVSTASSGSWVPISFKKDYLTNPDSNGVRALDANSKLVKAVECLDDIHPGAGEGEARLVDTKTALASPLKAAARYLLGKPGDENNITSLGGGNRSGSIKKVIIFETDGEPWENAPTTNSAITLNNSSDIFSRASDYTSSPAQPTGSATNGSTSNGRPNGISRPNWCPNNGNTCTYQNQTSTATETITRTYGGGQKACDNFKQVADLAKQEGILIITIGYNLTTARCSGSNEIAAGSDNTVNDGAAWISGLTPASCRASGNGSRQSPYVGKSNCTQTITWSVPRKRTVTQDAQDPNDPLVTEVLAAASGGGDIPTATSNGCSSPALTAEENADDDLFFCAARGDDLAPLFVTALSRVSSGVKLMNLPTG